MKRIFVFSNLATSLDGKIATASREPFYLGTPADRRQMQVLRKKCDVLLMGAGTLRTYQKFCGIRNAPAKRQPANAIVSASLEGVSPKWPFFQDPELRRLIFVTSPKNLTPARRRAFEKTSEIVELGPITAQRPTAVWILEALQKRGYQRLLVEGGGEMMWHFASRNLIDEYNVTLTPKIVGGSDSPTLVEGKGFAPNDILELKLHRCRRLGDELYLVYRKR
jgi:riboflavin-specific deaminase-like protein